MSLASGAELYLRPYTPATANHGIPRQIQKLPQSCALPFDLAPAIVRLCLCDFGLTLNLEIFVNSKVFAWVVRILSISALALPFAAVAQDSMPERLSGIINDYTPATGVSGPWEMHGTWSVTIKRDFRADFSAVMTMQHPDSWIAMNPGTPSSPNVDSPTARNPHTHHITMTDAMLSYNTTGCPVDAPPTTGRFVITGQPSVTGNGTPASFEAKGPSTLQVCVTGGSEVEFSNLTLAFASMSPASGHFGSNAIHGVVRFPRKPDERDKDGR
jgi:hypothetical protein